MTVSAFGQSKGLLQNIQYKGGRSIFLVPELPGDVLQPQHWVRVLAGAWAVEGEIHNKESRASLLSLSRALRRSSLGRGGSAGAICGSSSTSMTRPAQGH